MLISVHCLRWLKPIGSLGCKAGSNRGQNVLSLQGASHTHLDWDSVDTPINLTCIAWDVGSNWNPQRKPTWTWGEHTGRMCKLHADSGPSWESTFFPLINVIYSETTLNETVLFEGLCVHTSCICIFHSTPCLGVELDICIFNLVRNCQIVLQTRCTSLHSGQLCIRDWFASHPCLYLIWPVYISHSSGFK